METFRSILREARKKAHITIRELAAHLGVSIAYLSDFKRGQRAPLSPHRMKKVAEFLGVDFAKLQRATAETRQAITIEFHPQTRPKAKEIAVALALQWNHLSKEQIQQIADLLRAEKPKKEEPPTVLSTNALP